MDRRKFLLIAGTIVGILLIVTAIIYFIWQGTTQTKNQSSIVAISDFVDKIYSPQYVQNQNAIYYFNQGDLNKYSFSDKKTSLLYPEKIPYLKKAIFSPIGNYVILLVKEGGNFAYNSIDITTRQITTLPKNIFDAGWLTENKIVYSISDPSTKQYSLNTTDSKGGNIQKLTNLEFFDPVIVLSPDKNKIILYSEPGGYGENFLALYDITTSKLEKLNQKGLVGAVWSPDSQNIITNIFTENGFYTTTILNLTSQKTRNLDLNFELNKITWIDNDNLVGALAGENGFDEFHLISAKNGKSKLINIPKTEKSAINVDQIINYTSNSVLFTFNDFLYQLDVAK